MTEKDYMKRAIRLAQYGRGKVSPNPLVGAIVVKKDTIVGAGYHKNFGGDHAEITAIALAGKDVAGATLFCTLEPCSHRGKTPPCAEAIIASGIKRVVIGMKDPNPVVNGEGIKVLKKAGIEVRAGILEQECQTLNEPFIKYITCGRPYITVKMAQTLDGKIAKHIDSRTQITSEQSQRFVHSLRAEVDAILIGKQTAVIDDPLLTTRLVQSRTPARIILDTNLECNQSLQIFGTADRGSIYIATSSNNVELIKDFEAKGVSVIPTKRDKTGHLSLNDLLKKLGSLQISSVLVEGGASVFSSFLRERLVDKVILIIAPVLFGSGINVLDPECLSGMPPLTLESVSRRKSGRDIILTGTPVFNEDRLCSPE